MRAHLAEIDLEIRAGIHFGEVHGSGPSLSGTAINFSARIAKVAEPNEILASRMVLELVNDGFDFEDRGEHPLQGFDGTWSLFALTSIPAATENNGPPAEQQIRFHTSSDDVRIAYSVVGSGPPLVKAANWLSDLELDWTSPVWRHLLKGLSQDYQLLRYDERGSGLSDLSIDDLSFEALVSDLEEIIDVAGFEEFSLLGISEGCAVSIAYAARHPERVRRLVLVGGCATGWKHWELPHEFRLKEALLKMSRYEWGRETPAFQEFFTSLFIPQASADQKQQFSSLQRVTTVENAVRIQETFSEFDVRPLLNQVSAPTLVLHSRDDPYVPRGAGLELANGIQGSEFAVLGSGNHIVLREEPHGPRFIEWVRGFLAQEGRLATPISARDEPEGSEPDQFIEVRIVPETGFVDAGGDLRWHICLRYIGDEPIPLTIEGRLSGKFGEDFSCAAHLTIVGSGVCREVSSDSYELSFSTFNPTGENWVSACIISIPTGDEQGKCGNEVVACADVGETVRRSRRDFSYITVVTGSVPDLQSQAGFLENGKFQESGRHFRVGDKGERFMFRVLVSNKHAFPITNLIVRNLVAHTSEGFVCSGIRDVYPTIGKITKQDPQGFEWEIGTLPANTSVEVQYFSEARRIGTDWSTIQLTADQFRGPLSNDYPITILP